VLRLLPLLGGGFGARVGSVPENPCKLKSQTFEPADVKALMQADHGLTSSSIAGLHPNMKLGYQIWSYPDLSFPIWKPVILPESLDFED